MSARDDDRELVRAADGMAKAMAFNFEERVRESGAIAFRAGKARADCPARPGSAARLYWQRGYDAAKRAAKAAGSAS